MSAKACSRQLNVALSLLTAMNISIQLIGDFSSTQIGARRDHEGFPMDNPKVRWYLCDVQRNRR